MKKLAAKEAKNGFGRLLDIARREPVTIEKNGRPVAVMLSNEEFERLEVVEDAYWAMKTQFADKQGYLGLKKSEKLLRELLNAEG